MSSPDLLNKLAVFVPKPVVLAISRSPESSIEPVGEQVDAAVLFADTIDFTALSELLSRSGSVGAEELTHIINRYYTLIIQISEAYRGQVVKFSGDALTILFPVEEGGTSEAVRRAGECALQVQEMLGSLERVNTSQGLAPAFSMRVSIGAGSVLACNVGGELERWEYVVAGDPLVQVAAGQARAEPGGVVMSQAAWAHGQEWFSSQSSDSPFVELIAVKDPLPSLEPISIAWEELTQAQLKSAEFALKQYIPGAIKARLEDQTDWLAELRAMTSIFVGIGGLEYETDHATQRLQELVQAVQHVIYEFEGSLNKVAVDDKGTILLILFGAPPYSHEDDPQRAVMTALKLQAIAQRLEVRMSIGIATGILFAGPVGAPSRQEYTVIGDPVNLAARLMQHGRAGSIIISDQIQKQLGDQFVLNDLGCIPIKGKAAPQQAYQVTGEEGAQFEFLSHYYASTEALVGRKAELELIRRMSARTREGKLQILLIEGELGSGKSRLLAETVREWMAYVGPAYGGTCTGYGRQIRYQSWQQILSSIYGLSPDLSADLQQSRLQKAVAQLGESPEEQSTWLARLPLLKEITGVDIPENDFTHGLNGELRRNNIFALVERLLRHQTDNQPMLIVLEDVHWADELSLDLTAYLTQIMTDVPLFLVLSYRTIGREKNLEALETIRHHPASKTIQLDPLSEEESRTLINIFLEGKQLPTEKMDLLLTHGQGNPFYLQEITRAILNAPLEQPVLKSGQSEGLHLPSTVHNAILTRVDRLSDQEKLTLRVASVIGSTFNRTLLSDVHPVIKTAETIFTQLNGLVAENLVRLEMGEPNWEYAFRNYITHEVVYEGLLLSQRRQLHTRVGQALEQSASDKIDRLAYHYRQSDKPQKAIYYLKKAAEVARREYANQTAIDYLTETLTLLGQVPAKSSNTQKQNHQPTQANLFTAEYWDTVLERARLYSLVGRRNEEAEDLGTLGLLAEVLQDPKRRILAANQWASFYESMGDYASALEMIERGVKLTETLGDEQLKGEEYSYWGKLLFLSGNYNSANLYIDQALEIAQKHANHPAQADCLHNLGSIFYYQADFETAQKYFQEAVALWQTLSDHVRLGIGLCDLGRTDFKLGHYMTAHQWFSEALDLQRRIGDWRNEALTQYYAGQLERNLGNYEAAETMLTAALTMNQTNGNRHSEAETLSHLGFLHGRLGKHQKAMKEIEEAVEIIRELDDPWALSTALFYLGWIQIETGDIRLAQITLQEVLRLERDFKPGTASARIMEALSLLGRAALARDDLSLANTCAQHALKFIKEQSISNVEYPARVYLTTYEILQTSGKKDQATNLLKQAQKFIMTQANQIHDQRLRQQFLNNIPEHQQLLIIDAQ